jgi:hypothetical protein
VGLPNSPARAWSIQACFLSSDQEKLNLGPKFAKLPGLVSYSYRNPADAVSCGVSLIVSSAYRAIRHCVTGTRAVPVVSWYVVAVPPGKFISARRYCSSPVMFVVCPVGALFAPSAGALPPPKSSQSRPLLLCNQRGCPYGRQHNKRAVNTFERRRYRCRIVPVSIHQLHALVAHFAAFSRLRTSARTCLPYFSRWRAVAPPTFPVMPMTKYMLVFSLLFLQRYGTAFLQPRFASRCIS